MSISLRPALRGTVAGSAVAGSLIAFVLGTSGCTEKDAIVRMKVEAKTNQGDPVAAAVITVGGKKVGETDNLGRFAGEVPLPIGTKQRLEVRKDSDTYYFAPYYEGFTVATQSPQDAAFTATLYFVPKPAPEGAKAPAAVAAGGGGAAPAAGPTGNAAAGAASAAAAPPSSSAASGAGAPPSASATSGAGAGGAGGAAAGSVAEAKLAGSAASRPDQKAPTEAHGAAIGVPLRPDARGLEGSQSAAGHGAAAGPAPRPESKDPDVARDVAAGGPAAEPALRPESKDPDAARDVAAGGPAAEPALRPESKDPDAARDVAAGEPAAEPPVMAVKTPPLPRALRGGAAAAGVEARGGTENDADAAGAQASLDAGPSAAPTPMQGGGGSAAAPVGLAEQAPAGTTRTHVASGPAADALAVETAPGTSDQPGSPRAAAPAAPGDDDEDEAPVTGRARAEAGHRSAAEPAPAAVALTGVPEPEVGEDAGADAAAEATPGAAASPYAKAVRPNVGQTVFTVHVFSGETPVSEAEVFLGEEQAADLRRACTTNVRGRCVIRFPEKPEAPVTFVATKKGFKTASVVAPVSDRSKLRINLEHGQTLDIYALTKSYNHSVGLKDADVYVAGKRVGTTDRFGRYSYVYSGKADDLVAIGLKPRGFLPEAFDTDFVAAGPMTLVKYFTPDQPPAVRMTVLAAAPAGNMDKGALAALGPAFDDAVRAAARKHLFSSSAFKEYPLSLYERALRRAGRSGAEVLKSGWQELEMKAVVDAVLVPTLVSGRKTYLELSVIDSQGRVLAAAKEDLDGMSDKGSVERAVAVVAKKITRAFPFEGAVLAKEAERVVINLGFGHGRGVKAGDVLDVYGIQHEKMGRSQLFGKIATLTVREVADQTSKAAVNHLAPRATIERGDLIVLRPRKAPEAGAAEIRVAAGDGKHGPVTQANVYFNDAWAGATDEAGRLYLDFSGTGSMKIVKQGFAEVGKTVTVGPGARLDFAMKREAAFLRIDSKPPGATVMIEGRVVGKTPLSAGVAVPTGFVKLELEAPAGYKAYKSVLELDQGTLDLTGEARIMLEPDYRATAQKQLKAGRIDDALETYNQIPKEHSDYLLGRHEAGEIYLTLLDQPAKAAEAFGQVTAAQAVKEFADKRFIGSHINEGIALFLTAERLAATQPEAARAHYEKALQVLDAVVPHLRFVPADQYAQAVHNVDYHRALCRHRLWAASQDPRLLADTVKTWRTYLNGNARTLPVDGTSRTYVENAEVYFKQALASLNAAKGVAKQ